MKNKTILITGGTSGIGLATAQLLSTEGARVIVTGRNPETLAAARAALPETAIVLASDAGSLTAAQSLGAEVRKHVDILDGAFLNAGIATFAPMESHTPQHFDDIFNINVRGPFFQLQSLLPLLANPSTVVFTASVVASIGFPNSSIYSASKAALVSFGKTLAVELAPRGIRINVLSPGPVETPIFGKLNLPDNAMKSFEEATKAKALLKRFGQPDEIARTARFLLSPDSSFIVGSEVIIDGGIRLG
jgi:NAD(P)-dependent dehydrogenase (short-subunit alcohol dehydrogenase family)